MQRAWREWILTVLALAVVLGSVSYMLWSSVREERQFEGKLLAERSYMLMARALNAPDKCLRELVPQIKDYNPAGTAVSIANHSATLRARQAEVSEGVAAELSLQTPFGERVLPMLLTLQDGNAVACTIDAEALRFKLGGAVLSTSACVTPINTTDWVVHCPEGTFLNRGITPPGLFCCPFG